MSSFRQIEANRRNARLQFRERRQAHQKRQEIIDGTYRNAVTTEEDIRQNQEVLTSALDPQAGSRRAHERDPRAPVSAENADQGGDLTRSFVRLANLPTYPLDRLSRYEATLWRQACQILFTLRCLDRRKPWERLGSRLARDR